MPKRLLVTDERERLIILKFGKLHDQTGDECKKRLREKQAEIGDRIHGGYGQAEIRNIQIEKISKLAKELVAVDTEVYGKPTAVKKNEYSVSYRLNMRSSESPNKDFSK